MGLIIILLLVTIALFLLDDIINNIIITFLKKIFGISAIIFIILMPISRAYMYSKIAEYGERCESIYYQQKSSSDKRVDFILAKEIIDNDAWLKVKQYDSQRFLLKGYIPSDINYLKPYRSYVVKKKSKQTQQNMYKDL